MWSIAQLNRDSPGVGKLMYQVGDLHYKEILMRMGTKDAMECKTVYDSRSPEARDIEEVAVSVAKTLGELRSTTQDLVMHTVEPRDCYVAAAAWQMSLPKLAHVSMPSIVASLIQFDTSALELDLDMDCLSDPISVYRGLSLGCLALPLLERVDYDYRRLLKNIVQDAPPPEELIREVKEALAPITKGNKSKAAGRADEKDIVSPANESAPTTGSEKPNKGKGQQPAGKPDARCDTNKGDKGHKAGKKGDGKGKAANPKNTGNDGKGKGKGKGSPSPAADEGRAGAQEGEGWTVVDRHKGKGKDSKTRGLDESLRPPTGKAGKQDAHKPARSSAWARR
jgi:hypothetical protein